MNDDFPGIILSLAFDMLFYDLKKPFSLPQKFILACFQEK